MNQILPTKIKKKGIAMNVDLRYIITEAAREVLVFTGIVLQKKDKQIIERLSTEVPDNCQYVFSSEEEDSLNKIVLDLCLIIDAEDPTYVDVLDSCINSLKSLFAYIGDMNKVEMPSKINDIFINLTKKNFENNCYNVSFTLLESLINKVYKK